MLRLVVLLLVAATAGVPTVAANLVQPPVEVPFVDELSGLRSPINLPGGSVDAFCKGATWGVSKPFDTLYDYNQLQNQYEIFIPLWPPTSGDIREEVPGILAYASDCMQQLAHWVIYCVDHITDPVSCINSFPGRDLGIN